MKKHFPGKEDKINGKDNVQKFYLCVELIEKEYLKQQAEISRDDQNLDLLMTVIKYVINLYVKAIIKKDKDTNTLQQIEQISKFLDVRELENRGFRKTLQIATLKSLTKNLGKFSRLKGIKWSQLKISWISEYAISTSNFIHYKFYPFKCEQIQIEDYKEMSNQFKEIILVQE